MSDVAEEAPTVVEPSSTVVEADPETEIPSSPTSAATPPSHLVTSDGCTVLFQTRQGIVLRELFNTIAPLLVDGHLVFDKTGLHIRQATVGLYVANDLTTPETYVYNPPNNEGELFFPLSLATINGCLKKVSQVDIVSIQITPASIQACCIHLWIQSDDCSTRYDIQLLDLERQALSSPVFTIDTIVTLPTTVFLQQLQKADKPQAEFIQLMADVNLESQVGHVYFTAQGDECKFTSFLVYPIDTPIANGELCDINLETHRRCGNRLLYRIKTLIGIAKATNMSQYVRIMLPTSDSVDESSWEPLILQYSIGTLGYAKFCVLPNVDLATTTLQELQQQLFPNNPLPIADDPIVRPGSPRNAAARKRARNTSLINSNKRLSNTGTRDWPGTNTNGGGCGDTHKKRKVGGDTVTPAATQLSDDDIEGSDKSDQSGGEDGEDEESDRDGDRFSGIGVGDY